MTSIKMYVSLAAALLCAGFLLCLVSLGYAQNRKASDKDKSDLEALWKEYGTIIKKDKPQSAEAVLQRIMDISLEKCLSWDYYKALTSQYQNEISRNWKNQEPAAEKMDILVKRYNDPFVSLYHSIHGPYRRSSDMESLFSTVQSSKAVLQSRFTAGFLENLGYSKVSPVIKSDGFFKDDYQQALWVLWQRFHDDSVMDLLLGEFAGSYPQESILKYAGIVYRYPSYKPEYSSAMKEFASLNAGNAASLLAEESLLRLRMENLTSDNCMDDSKYKELAADCEKLISRRKAFSGGVEKIVASCCTDVDNLLSSLRRKDISFEIKGGVASVRFMNLPSSELTIKSEDGKKTVFKTTVQNRKQSFYLTDTVEVAIPVLDDGTYTSEVSYSKALSQKSIYKKYSIAVACRKSDRGYEIYAANASTGEPMKEVSGIALDGFTVLPEDMVSKIVDDKKGQLVFSATGPSGEKLLSEPVHEYDFSSYYSSQKRTYYNSIILTDCGAYQPLDTVRFKAISYSRETEPGKAPVLNVLPAGESVVVKMTDPEGEAVGEMTLVTNEFGSVGGEFVIPEGRRNGRYYLSLSGENSLSGSASFRVEEYVLPSFEVSMNPQTGDIHPGDSFSFGGMVKSYSGRAISTDLSTYELNLPDGSTESGKLDIHPDGSFEVHIDKAGRGGYSLSVTVVDATGESKTFSSWVEVSNYVYIWMDIRNSVEGVCSEQPVQRYYAHSIHQIIVGDTLDVKFMHENNSGVQTPVPVTYSVLQGGRKILSGETVSNTELRIALPESGSGLYTVEAQAHMPDGSSLETPKVSETVMKLKREASSLDVPLDHVIIPEEDRPGFLIGSSKAPMYALVNILSSDGKVLLQDAVHLDGKAGEPGSLKRVLYSYDKSWGEMVTVVVYWFRNYSFGRWEKSFGKPYEDDQFGVEFTSFTDRTSPSVRTTVSVKVPQGSEVTATVYDKATHDVARLYWQEIYEGTVETIVPDVHTYAGSNSSQAPVLLKYSMAKTRAAGVFAVEESAMMDSAPMAMASNEVMEYDDDEVEEEAIPFVLLGEETPSSATVRNSFEDVLAFHRYLYPDKDGNVDITFTPSGKLSTYIVKVYAHNKAAKSAENSREIVVSIPVQVSVAEPQFLYEGDKYVLNASLSALPGTALKKGTVVFEAFDGKDRSSKPLLRKAVKAVLSDGLGSCSFEIPKVPSCQSGELGLLVSFTGKTETGEAVSDAVMVSVPVLGTTTLMKESHSMLYKAGDDRNMIISLLKSQFTNLKPNAAEVSERRIMDMVSEVLDSEKTPSYEDAVSIMRSLEVRLLSQKLSGSTYDDGGLWEKLRECRSSDGGYSWRKGMESSQSVTSFVLSGIAMLKSKGCLPEKMMDYKASVEYLDRQLSASQYSWWYIGTEQYCHLRSQFADIPFKTDASKEFKKAVKDYLTPKDESSMRGNILSKARRVLTLDNLSSSDEGAALAKAWGITLGTSRKLSSTRRMDIESLREYAAEHRSGGIYFPNAVMPFRGLLESELHAHTVLTEVFSQEDPSLADGIRLWLMLQKETQAWDSDPASILAVAAVMDGSEDLLKTSVISLTAKSQQKFSDVRAAANGFTIKARYLVQRGNEWTELKKGDVLKVGQKVKAEYSVHSDENRSFVMMQTPHPANLLAENQMSGRYGWRLYRDVKKTSSQWWWDAFPEEDSVFSEMFTVWQEGVFQSPSATIECLYAPSYMANENHPSDLSSEF